MKRKAARPDPRKGNRDHIDPKLAAQWKREGFTFAPGLIEDYRAGRDVPITLRLSVNASDPRARKAKAFAGRALRFLHVMLFRATDPAMLARAKAEAAARDLIWAAMLAARKRRDRGLPARAVDLGAIEKATGVALHRVRELHREARALVTALPMDRAALAALGIDLITT
ncbi:MAG TPA: hypothetical protein VGS03_01910 [Candidatus Polarisedimenticolia bacterium]|jgi:hypothetical protein|nr:hypothetical protein [Candidatus Polarisedimenticolia bacterium]